MAPIADLRVILTYFLDSVSYATVFFNKLWYELSGPPNVYTYVGLRCFF